MSRNKAVIQDLLAAYRVGATLREAAAAAGVHVATVCRWQKRDPALRQALGAAREQFRESRGASQGARPQVPWRRDCPLCKARVAVRTARGEARFWRCGRWPHCGWASWRPRAPRDCPACGGPRYWSHSRKSISCPGCGKRVRCRSWQESAGPDRPDL